MAAVIELTQANFDEYFAKPLLAIEFWAPWCEPCHAFRRYYEEMAAAYPAIVFTHVNVDEQKALAKDFSVRSVPTLVIVYQQTMILHQAGLLPKSALQEVLAQALVVAKA